MKKVPNEGWRRARVAEAKLAETEKRLREFLDGYHGASEEINKALGTNEDFERIDREMFEYQQMSWARHVTAKVEHLKAKLAEARAEVERLRAALGFAYTELCEIERLTSSQEQALHVLRAIGFCKYDKQPEWDERMDAALAPAQPKEKPRLHSHGGWACNCSKPDAPRSEEP